MHRGAQITVGGQLQQFADVHHQRVVAGQRIDPAPFLDFHLQPGLLVLQEKAEEPGILVRADALLARVGGLAWIAHQLDVFVGLVAVQLIERVRPQRQRLGKGTQQTQRHARHRLLPFEQQRF